MLSPSASGSPDSAPSMRSRLEPSRGVAAGGAAGAGDVSDPQHVVAQRDAALVSQRPTVGRRWHGAPIEHRGATARPEHLRRDEQRGAIRETGLEEAAVRTSAPLDQHGLHVRLGQVREHAGELDPFVVSRDRDHARATREARALRRGSGRRRVDPCRRRRGIVDREDRRMRIQVERRAQDGAKSWRAHAGQPHGQPRVVATHGSGADEDRVVPQPQPVGETARRVRGDPARLSAERRDHAVDGDRGLQGDARSARRVEVEKRSVQTGRGVGHQSHRHVDAGLAQRAEAPAVDQRVRIAHRGDDPPDAGLDHAVHARRRASLVGARLEVHVQRGAAGPLPRLVERARFRVGLPRSPVPAAAHDAALADHDAAHAGIRADRPLAESGQREGLLHEASIGSRRVGRVPAHAAPSSPSRPSTNASRSNSSRSSIASPTPTCRIGTPS
jgi:hypothetical protein